MFARGGGRGVGEEEEVEEVGTSVVGAAEAATTGDDDDVADVVVDDENGRMRPQVKACLELRVLNELADDVKVFDVAFDCVEKAALGSNRREKTADVVVVVVDMVIDAAAAVAVVDNGALICAMLPPPGITEKPAATTPFASWRSSSRARWRDDAVVMRALPAIEL